jgi:hypothetical protein
MTDYASELLGGAKQQAPSRDYAADLLGGSQDEPAEKPQTFSQNIASRKAELTGTADFKTLVKAAMVDDPQTKLRIFASDMFPGEKDAVDRFGFHNGEVYYVGKDDKLYKANPPDWMGAKEIAASITGNLPTIAGGTIGGVAGATAGPVGSIGGAALGAAGGKGFQQSIANLALDEPQTPEGNIAGMAKEAAFAGGGSALGVGLQKWLGRNLSKDISKLNMDDVAELERKASNVKVDLNAAQKTNLPSLRGRVEALARIPQSADDMNAALEATRQQAGAAADDFVASVSPTTESVRAGGEAGRKGAASILEKIAKDRSIAAKPWYDRALNKNLDPRVESLGNLPDTPAFKSAFERGKRIAANEGIDGATFDNVYNMRTLHYVKLGLDDLIEKGGMKEGIGSTEKRAIVGVKNRLLEFMDRASPDYARARSIYGHFMPTLKANREGLVGQLAELADTDLQGASRQVFNAKNSPNEIARLRSMFYRYDQGEQWKGMLKGYLQDTLEQASREVKSGPGAGKAVTWRYMLLGDPKQKANLRASMTAEQFQGFQDMMDVFEAVGRTSGRGNSITMPMTEAASELKKEAGAGIVGKALQPRQTVINWLEEARLGKHAQKQVEILTDPQGLKRLKELKRLSPTDQRIIQGFSTLFGVTASPE